jgi:hypothetical protein
VRSRWRIVEVGYVSLIAGLALYATWHPHEIREHVLAATLALCLPAIVALIPAIYIVIPIVWRVTDFDDGGPGWPVTLAYTAVLTGIAVANVALVRAIVAALKTARSRRIQARRASLSTTRS